MKRHSSLMVLAAAIMAGVFSACTSAPSGAMLLPEDNTFVLSIDVQEMVQKSGMQNDKELGEQMKGLIAGTGLPEDQKGQLQHIVDNPQDMGIDLREPLFLALSHNVDQKEPLFTGTILDKEKFESFVEMIMNSEVNEWDARRNLRYARLDYDVYLMFNKNAFLFHIDNSNEEEKILNEMAEYFSLSSNYASTEGYKFLMKEKGMFKMHIDYDQLMNMEIIQTSVPQLTEVATQLYEAFEDVHLITSFTMDKGEATLSTALMTSSEKTKQMFKDASAYMGSVDGDNLKYIDSKALFTAAVNLDGEKYVEVMESTGKNPLASIPLYQMVKESISSIDGDIIFSIGDKMISNYLPSMAMYVDTDNDYVVKTIGRFLESIATKNGKTEWSIPLTAFLPQSSIAQEDTYINFGYKRGTSYCMLNSGKTEGLKKSEEPIDDERFNGNRSYALVNVAQIFASPDLNLGNTQIPIEGKVALKLMNAVDYIEMVANDDNRAVLRMVMKDKSGTPFEVYRKLINNSNIK